MAKEGQEKGDRNNQLYVNSSINDTVLSFRSDDKEPIRIDFETSLRNIELSKRDDLVINTTYDQILNLSHNQIATFEYLFIDESHALTNDLDFRADKIAALIYHLIEFVAKNPDAKTKIVFMSGTPNVETIVIHEIMKDYKIERLFQRIIVKKEYAVAPKINLIHLDTNNKIKREDSGMKQIEEYLNNQRKVVYIFNNKEKMAEMERIIQTKLGNKIKVGLFYSGSTGECTQNILSGKFGDFDVILTTSYFINGININKDGLAEEEIKAEKTSAQKYGVVIDLGNKYSCISAMDTIQTVNRFRNRLCEATVFFTKIFKPDEANPTRKFHFGNAARILLGINKYNFHLLSVNENKTPNQIEEEEEVAENKIHYLDKFRNNPLGVSLIDIKAASKQEENKRQLTSMIEKESRLYKDWYYSLDGYHYLCKDAGFNTVITHKDLEEPLKEMTEDQIELENKIIKNFIEDKKGISFIFKEIDFGKRVIIKASNKVLDPSSTNIGNFSETNYKNNTFIFQGDFHSSYERAINKLFRCYFKLNYYYDSEKALDIMKYLINPEVDLLSKRENSFLKSITKYVRLCNFLRSDKYLKALNFILALDYLAKKNLGVVKVEKPTWTSYTVIDSKIVEVLKNMSAKQQYEMIEYKLNLVVQKNDWSLSKLHKNKTLNSKDYKKIYFEELYGNYINKNRYILESQKNDFQKHYSNKELIKRYDLEDMEYQLKEISEYTPLSYNKKGELKSLETIIVPRIIRSSKLLMPLEIDEDKYSQPEQSTLKDIDREADNLVTEISEKLENYAPIIIRKNNPYLDLFYGYAVNRLQNRDLYGLMVYVNNLINNPRSNYKPGLLPVLKKIQHDLSKVDKIFLTAFKTSEYMTNSNLNNQVLSPFNKDIFFCEEDFKLKSLDQKPTSGITNINKNDIYESLRKNSKLYKGAKSIRPRSSSGRRLTISISNLTNTAFVVLDKNCRFLFADFSKSNACKLLCNYAFKNEDFKLKNGTSPVKNHNKGIYNPDTFRKDYYPKKSINKTVDNYSIEVYDVNIKDYKDYVDSL